MNFIKASGNSAAADVDPVTRIVSSLESLDNLKRKLEDADLISIVQELLRTKEKCSRDQYFDLWVRIIKHCLKSQSQHLAFTCIKAVFKDNSLAEAESRCIGRAEFLYGNVIMHLVDNGFFYGNEVLMRLDAIEKFCRSAERACASNDPLAAEITASLEACLQAVNGHVFKGPNSHLITAHLEKVTKVVFNVYLANSDFRTLINSNAELQQIVLGLYYVCIDIYSYQKEWHKGIKLIEKLFRIMPQSLQDLRKRKLQLLTESGKAVALILLKDADVETQANMWRMMARRAEDVIVKMEAYANPSETNVNAVIYAMGASLLRSKLDCDYKARCLHYDSCYTSFKGLMKSLFKSYGSHLELERSLKPPAKGKAVNAVVDTEIPDVDYPEKWPGYSWPASLQTFFADSTDKRSLCRSSLQCLQITISIMLDLFLSILETNPLDMRLFPIASALELILTGCLDGKERMNVVAIATLLEANLLSYHGLPDRSRRLHSVACEEASADDCAAWPWENSQLCDLDIGCSLSRAALTNIKARALLYRGDLHKSRQALISGLEDGSREEGLNAAYVYSWIYGGCIPITSKFDIAALHADDMTFIAYRYWIKNTSLEQDIWELEAKIRNESRRDMMSGKAKKNILEIMYEIAKRKSGAEGISKLDTAFEHLLDHYKSDGDWTALSLLYLRHAMYMRKRTTFCSVYDKMDWLLRTVEILQESKKALANGENLPRKLIERVESTSTVYLSSTLLAIALEPDPTKPVLGVDNIEEILDDVFADAKRTKICNQWTEVKGSAVQNAIEQLGDIGIAVAETCRNSVFVATNPSWQRVQPSLLTVEALEIPKLVTMLLLATSRDGAQLYYGVVRRTPEIVKGGSHLDDYEIKTGTIQVSRAVLERHRVTLSTDDDQEELSIEQRDALEGLRSIVQPIYDLIAEAPPEAAKAPGKSEKRKGKDKDEPVEPERRHLVICADLIIEGLPLEHVFKAANRSISRDFGMDRQSLINPDHSIAIETYLMRTKGPGDSKKQKKEKTENAEFTQFSFLSKNERNLFCPDDGGFEGHILGKAEAALTILHDDKKKE
ncbi:hypothetical protein HK101_005086 [Irineochytrium annulatum]|nr:hypothetical protein HK101_005086 [Irineochytrium annulatum]